jgi:nucleolar protein TMA23
MDAAALLKSQGWRGKGFSLHPTDNAIGLSKPLLISRNTDGRGIGQKTHYTSDQWWLHAFDQKLKGLDTSKKGTVVQSVTHGKLDVIAPSQPNGKYTGVSGLYASFVRGGMLEGTLEAKTGTGESTDATPATSEDSEGSVSRKERRGESKAEREARRAARRLRKAAEAKAAEKAAKKAAKKELKKARRANETKEERRARRAERRAHKEAKRRKREGGTLSTPDQG